MSVDPSSQAIWLESESDPTILAFYRNMGTTAERNKNRTRPRKPAGPKGRRQREQKKRLIALGMDEATVAKINSRDVLTKLKHPAKVVKECAAQSS